jgi:hypothetical protein
MRQMLFQVRQFHDNAISTALQVID